MLPTLVYVFGYPLPMAIGTTVTAAVPTATSGAVAHVGVRGVDFRTARVVGASGALGAVAGSVALLHPAPRGSGCSA